MSLDINVGLKSEENEVKNVWFVEASLGKLMKRSIPTILSCVLMYAEIPVMVTFLGHLENPVYLAAGGLAISSTTILILSSLWGFNMSLDSVNSQALGTNDVLAANANLNKVRFLICLLWVPFFIISLCSKYIVQEWMGKSAEFATEVQSFMQISSVAGLFCGHYDAIRKYIIQRGYASVTFAINLLTLTVHISLCYLFIFQWELNVKGAALSWTVTELLNVSLAYAFCKLYKVNVSENMHHDEYIETHLAAMQESLNEDMWFVVPSAVLDSELIRLGLYSMCTLALEWWAFEVVTVMSGLLGYVSVGAQTIAFTFNALVFNIALGLSVGTSTMVGGSISLNNVHTAKIYSMYSVVIISVIVTPIIITMILNPDLILDVYTSNQEVKDELKSLLYWKWIVIFICDNLQGTLGGSIRGLGLQKKSTLVVLVYYIFGMPLFWYKGFYLQEGLLGIWEIFQYCNLVHAGGFAVILITANWEFCALKQNFSKGTEENYYDEELNENNTGDNLTNKKETLIDPNNYDLRTVRRNNVELEMQDHE